MIRRPALLALFGPALLGPALLGAQVRPPARPIPRPAPATVPPVPAMPLAHVSGVVMDSINRVPLVGASVQFVLASDPTKIRSAVTDSLGRYRVDSLSLGAWLVGVIHEQYERLGVDGRLVQFIVDQSGDLTLPLGTPSFPALVAIRCPSGPNAGNGDGGFFGFVRTANGQPLAGPARVRVQYPEVTVSSSGVQRRFPARFIDANPNGAFAACGIPANTQVTTRAYAGTDSSGTLELSMPANGILIRDLLVASPLRVTEAPRNASDRPRTVLRGAARVRGVVRDTVGKPLNGVRVVLPGDDAQGATTSAGAFNINGLPAGTWMLEARAVGFQPLRFAVDLRDSAETVVDVNLLALTPTVDTVKVKADRWAQQLVGFEQRRKMSVGGYFFDEKKITDRNTTHMSDLLRGTPGVTIQPGMNGRDQVKLRGTQGTGQCYPNVFLNGVYTAIDNGVLEDIIRPEEIRAMEVYPGTASQPIEFQRPNGCGAIAIWTGPKSAAPPKR